MNAARNEELSSSQLGLLLYALQHADAEFTVGSHPDGRADLSELVQRGYLIEQRIGAESVYSPAQGLEQKLALLL